MSRRMSFGRTLVVVEHAAESLKAAHLPHLAMPHRACNHQLVAQRLVAPLDAPRAGLVWKTPAMPTRNISLTPTLDRAVEKLVQSGRYESASEVVRAGLRALLAMEREQRVKLQHLRKAIAEGDASGFAEDSSLESILQEAGLSKSARRKKSA